MAGSTALLNSSVLAEHSRKERWLVSCKGSDISAKRCSSQHRLCAGQPLYWACPLGSQIQGIYSVMPTSQAAGLLRGCAGTLLTEGGD